MNATHSANQLSVRDPEQKDEKSYKIFISYTHWGDPEKNGISRYTRWLNIFPILRRYLKARRMNNAFVYCHDYFEACRLESGLRSFRFPRKLRQKYGIDKKRPVTVFRDESELTNGELTSSIQDALRRTDYLLVVHSRHSRQKPWISKEIAYFLESGKSPDRLIHWAIDGIPFVSLPAGKPAIASHPLIVHPDECIPPVVLQLYPDSDHTPAVIDKNVEKPAKGFNYRLERAIGAAYHLSPSELRSIAFRRRLRNLGWWLLLLLLIGAGCTARYYLYTETHYYVNYVPRHNIPYGITEIRKDQTPYYQTHVIIQTRAGKVRRFELRNYQGEPAEDNEVTDPSFGSNIVELEYDDRTGEVSKLRSLDEDGILQNIFIVYSDSLIGLNKRNGEFTTLTTLDNSQSDFSFLRIRRNGQGEIIRMYTLPDNRSDITETTPYIILERNAQGLITRIDQSHASLFPGHDDAANYTLAYAADGSVCSITNFNSDGVPTLNENGAHRTVLTGQGTPQRTVAYYDTEGKPCLNSQGCYRLIQTVTKDSAGKQFISRIQGYDTEGRPAKTRFGVHRIDESWKADHSQTAIRYFDANGNAVSHTNGYHAIIYRQNDTLKSIAYYDTAGRRTLNLEEGVAVEKVRYSGNRREKTFYNVQLQPCNNITAKAGRIVQETDNDGNIIYLATFLDTGLPARVNSYPPVKRMEYDKKGNCIAL
ncbi:MAG: toll/interleukin-1 receptor domain-containing protein [Parabacteroides sp.]|nr:toll/interleukin-1 receptor domain-containing protein [Parabacteroides sp.]